MATSSGWSPPAFAAEMRTGNPENQHEWHESYRDNMTNMYRTSYQDMIHGREVAVKNDMPAGYGGHIPSLRHDVLFRNTAFDRKLATLKNDFGRDTFPSFTEQNEGVPSFTEFPRGKKKPPTIGTVPDVKVSPPWALTLNLQEPPSFRTSPTRSARGASGGIELRRNTAATRAGQSVAHSVPVPGTPISSGSVVSDGTRVPGVTTPIDGGFAEGHHVPTPLLTPTGSVKHRSTVTPPFSARGAPSQSMSRQGVTPTTGTPLRGMTTPTSAPQGVGIQGAPAPSEFSGACSEAASYVGDPARMLIPPTMEADPTMTLGPMRQNPQHDATATQPPYHPGDSATRGTVTSRRQSGNRAMSTPRQQDFAERSHVMGNNRQDIDEFVAQNRRELEIAANAKSPPMSTGVLTPRKGSTTTSFRPGLDASIGMSDPRSMGADMDLANQTGDKIAMPRETQILNECATNAHLSARRPFASR
eukprot:TRINITY_DN48535_c0_g1_i1.p1 TRINITY_DN48535_c0_g1~~TRINITY_DN48535_c0_g1_i1.p1  ORF type:complete len:496 (+),score=52.10 TRINITY_DN48535_c0_g1_i1:72-1490(+)